MPVSYTVPFAGTEWVSQGRAQHHLLPTVLNCKQIVGCDCVRVFCFQPVHYAWLDLLLDVLSMKVFIALNFLLIVEITN